MVAVIIAFITMNRFNSPSWC